MKYLTVLAVVLLTIAVGAFIWFKVTSLQTSELSAPVVFTSPEDGTTVSILFDEKSDTAILNGIGYTDLVLEHSVSASGARYINDETELELWNRGNEVSITKSGQNLFKGNVGGLNDSDRLRQHEWVWQATTNNEEVIEPRTDKVFTLRFDEEGNVNGRTDCNSFFGTYSVKDDTALSFGTFGMTKMFCPDSQEMEFLEMLARAESFNFTGSGALSLSLSGEETMLFTRE